MGLTYGCGETKLFKDKKSASKNGDANALKAFGVPSFLWQFLVAWSGTKTHDNQFVKDQCEASSKFNRTASQSPPRLLTFQDKKVASTSALQVQSPTAKDKRAASASAQNMPMPTTSSFASPITGSSGSPLLPLPMDQDMGPSNAPSPIPAHGARVIKSNFPWSPPSISFRSRELASATGQCNGARR